MMSGSRYYVPAADEPPAADRKSLPTMGEGKYLRHARE
jgi:hypothetical protein